MKQKQSRNELFNRLVSAWNHLHDSSKIPDLLWHYTTFEGLIGILHDNALRATFSQTLNDGSEWAFGKEIVKRFPIPKNVSKALKSPLVVDPPKAIFVTCFCERPDLLSMWRSYTVSGGGYCLGFDGPKLNELQRDDLVVNDFAARLVKMYYGTRLPTRMKDLLQCGGDANAAWVIENMIKHPGFREEQEWRIIVPNPPASLMSFHSAHATTKASVQIRNHNGDKKLPLRRIVLGPTIRKDIGLDNTLAWLLERHGYSGVKLESSNVPYRLQ
jgi:hypothetical protein